MTSFDTVSEFTDKIGTGGNQIFYLVCLKATWYNMFWKKLKIFKSFVYTYYKNIVIFEVL
jgi:hypothetical protein